MDITLRPATPEDAEACEHIVYEAFKSIAVRHNFPLDFPTPERVVQLAGFVINHPGFFGVVAESEGKIVGSNFLDQRDLIRGVSPSILKYRLVA